MKMKQPFSVSANGTMIGLALFFSLLVMFALWQLDSPKEKESPSSDTVSSTSTPKKEDWFEYKKSLYHGIPSRILFRFEHRDEARATELSRKAWEEFERIGQVFNPFDPQSETGKLNRRTSSKGVRVSEDVQKVLQDIATLYKASEGAFDPTLWPIKRLWRDAVERQRIPKDEELAEAVEKTGFDKVHVYEEGFPKLDLDRDDLTFDFGGIAKGYAVDRVRNLLKAEGAGAGLVQCGGEIATFGEKSDGSWVIGVQHPKDLRALWGTVNSKTELRVSTSGNYRQPLLIGEKRFYHIFDPRNGRPVQEKIAGVTVASFDANVSNALLDALATSITVLGSKKGLELAKHFGVEALILVNDGDSLVEVVSDGFASHFRKRKHS